MYSFSRSKIKNKKKLECVLAEFSYPTNEVSNVTYFVMPIVDFWCVLTHYGLF